MLENGMVIEFDIKGLFDNIDHELMMKEVHKHTDNKWAILYIERFLKAPIAMPDGTIVGLHRTDFIYIPISSLQQH